MTSMYTKMRSIKHLKTITNNRSDNDYMLPSIKNDRDSRTKEASRKMSRFEIDHSQPLIRDVELMTRSPSQGDGEIRGFKTEASFAKDNMQRTFTNLGALSTSYSKSRKLVFSRGPQSPMDVSSYSKTSKVQMSHFMFDEKNNKDSDRENIFSRTKDSLRTATPKTEIHPLFSRPATTNNRDDVKTAFSKLSESSTESGIFKTRLKLKSIEYSKKKLKDIENKGPFKRLPRTPAEVKKYNLHEYGQISEESELVKPDIWSGNQFKLNDTVSTKNKLQIKLKSKKKAMVKKVETNEEVIAKNKDKLMVCVDDVNDFAANVLSYCFVGREIEKTQVGQKGKNKTKAEVEFNIKVNEIQKRLRLSREYKHVYLMNGSSVFELEQIPPNQNVIIISKQTELRSVEAIIQHGLVQDFYEYGTKKDIAIYSRSHLGSRMDSFVNANVDLDRKVQDVLKVFDDDTQLNSEQLAKLVSSSKNEKMNSFTNNVHQFYQDNDIITEEDELESQGRPRRSSGRHSSRNGNDSQMDRIILEYESIPSAYENMAREDRIESYMNRENQLANTEKLDVYKNILDYYENANPIKMNEQESDRSSNNGDEIDANNEEIYQTIKLDNISKHLEVLLKRFKRPKKKLDYLDIKKEMQKSRGDWSNTHARSTAAENMLMVNNANLDMEEVEAKNIEKMNEHRDFMAENIKVLRSKKGDIDKLHRANRELFSYNIPKFISQKKLTRRELHFVWILYKALCEVTSQRYQDYHLGDGIDYHSFRNGIYQVFLQSEELAERVFYAIDCNFSGFLNWEEFVDAMVNIRARTMRDKVDLFIKIADEDKNGRLSKDEIFGLAKICLSKFVKDVGDGFLDTLCEYFTKLIFSSVGVSQDEEIPLEAIKDVIVSGGEEASLLAMFCGADI